MLVKPLVYGSVCRALTPQLTIIGWHLTNLTDFTTLKSQLLKFVAINTLLGPCFGTDIKKKSVKM